MLLPAYHGILLCSLRNPPLLQRSGAGSHLYPAHRHTVRSGHRIMVLPTLMSAALTSSQAPYGSFPLGLPYPRQFQESAFYRYAALMVLLTLKVLRPLDNPLPHTRDFSRVRVHRFIIPYWWVFVKCLSEFFL